MHFYVGSKVFNKNDVFCKESPYLFNFGQMSVCWKFAVFYEELEGIAKGFGSF